MHCKLSHALFTVISLSFAFGCDAFWSAVHAGPYCLFQNIDVPCTKLAREKLFTVVHRLQYKPTSYRVVHRLQYKPLKGIPIWPNNDVLGGRDKHAPEFPDNAYFNRTEADAQRTIITALSVDTYDFGDFADDRFDIPEFRRFMDTQNVYFGDKIFELWIKATERGVICGQVTVDESDGTNAKSCAFVRKRSTKDRAIILEYCFFIAHSDRYIPGENTCVDVAKSAGRKKYVLASEYIYFGGDLGYGGGEGHYDCHLDDVSLELIKGPFADFVRSEVGPSGTINESESHDHPGTARIQAGALNVRDATSGVWVRKYLDTYVGPQDMKPGSEFEISTNFTISVRASDDLIDYREPNSSMGNRLRNELQSRARLFALNFSKAPKCDAVGLF
jgi:hypothetical protein